MTLYNTRTFSADEGEKSIGNAGPTGIETDINHLLANDQELNADIIELQSDKMGIADNGTITGIKTFTVSPIVPEASANNHPATKGYVDSKVEAVGMGDANTLGGELPEYYAVASELFDISHLEPVVQASSEILVLERDGQRILYNSTSAITITVPPNSSVEFPIGAEIEAVRYNTGAVTFQAGSGVTILSADSKLSISTRYASASLVKIGTDIWLLIGALS